MPSPMVSKVMNTADTIYGTMRRWNEMPLESIATTSESWVILEVKKMTVRNTNMGEYMFMKYGMKPR